MLYKRLKRYDAHIIACFFFYDEEKMLLDCSVQKAETDYLKLSSEREKIDVYIQKAISCQNSIIFFR